MFLRMADGYDPRCSVIAKSVISVVLLSNSKKCVMTEKGSNDQFKNENRI